MATSMSKEEYLKRYLSENAEEKKKKRRKKVKTDQAKKGKIRIVDDDIDLKSLVPNNEDETVDDYVGDNDPVIAEVIDERPEHVKLLEKYRTSSAWKTLAEDDGEKVSKEAESFTKKGSSGKQRHDSDSDYSPPKKTSHKDSNVPLSKDSSVKDDLPRKRKSRFTDSSSKASEMTENSPIKRQRHDSDSDHSPLRRQRHDSNSDQSPPRRTRHDSDSDQSPVRRKRHDSNSDQSPPRRQRHDSDQSPIRRKRLYSDSDQSPPRRRQLNSDSDQSPPRRRKHDSDSDQSPPRRRKHDSDSDQSPPRRSKTSRYNSSNTKTSADPETKANEKTLSGKKAGLSSARDMRLEADELRRKEEEKFKQISEDRLGRDAATVFRDKKSGRRRNLSAEREENAEEARKKAKEDEQFNKWGKGLKQLEQHQERVAEALHEADKPLARYKDDDDLDQMLREMDRAEDPMLAFIKKKKKNTGPPVKEKPRYKGPAPPPNRFGIMPGYRWDGVDRSNGFEKQIFAKMASSKATASAAYKWSVEDM